MEAGDYGCSPTAIFCFGGEDLVLTAGRKPSPWANGPWPLWYGTAALKQRTFISMEFLTPAFKAVRCRTPQRSSLQTCNWEICRTTHPAEPMTLMVPCTMSESII